MSDLRSLVYDAAIPAAFAETVGTVFRDTGRFLFGTALRSAWESLDASGIEIESAALDEFGEPMVRLASIRGARLAVLELNLASAAGILPGESGEEQYSSFMAALAGGAYRQYLETKYPVYFQTETQRFRLAAEYLHSLAKDALADRAVLSEQFGVRSYTSIVSIGHLGDPHRGGRRTAVLQFDTGNRLVYKPRGSANDRFFHRLASELTPHLPFGLRVPKTVEVSGHSWQEYIAEETELGLDTAIRDLTLVQKLGTWLAVAQVTGLTDVHHENVRLDHGDPVIVDYECTFASGRLARSIPIPEAAAPRTLSVGILPRIVRMPGDERYRNWGIIGRRHSEPVIGQFHLAEADGTPAVRLVPGQFSEHGGDADDSQVIPRSVADALLSGYDLGVEALLAISGRIPEIASEARIVSRIVLRPTQTYMDAVRVSNFPRFYQSFEAYRNAVREVLVGQDDQMPSAVLEAEVESLLNGDVPIATVDADQTALVLHGLDVNAGLFTRSQGDCVTENLMRLKSRSSSLIERRAIWQSLAVVDRECTPARLYTPPRGRMKRESRDQQILRAAARRLIDNAICVDGTPFWTNAIPGDDAVRVLDLGTTDLYRGSLGITLAMAAANAVVQDSAVADFLASYGEAIRRWSASAANPHVPGFFHGDAGLAFWLASMAEYGYISRADARRDVALLFGHVEKQARSLALTDVISGLAGILKVARELSRNGYLPESAALSVAELCTDGIASAAISVGAGRLAWPDGSGSWLGGFGHGAAGVAWALQSSGSPRELELSSEAARTQRSLWDPIAHQWLDRREDGASKAVFNGWCHGSDGIVLAATSIPDVIAADGERRVQYLRGWLESPHVPDISLCHGVAGRLETLCTLSAAPAALSGEVDCALARRRALDLLPSVLRVVEAAYVEGSGWGALCDSLMVGGAGAVHAVAKLTAGGAVGSVLDCTLPASPN